MIPGIEIIGRILLAAILGGLIGIEREVNNRPAGLRTHVLVTLGSTLIMLISIDGFNASEVSRMADPSRLAAQVVSGIGFLGAGTIMRTGSNISGLTTAASLWVSAGIGLGIGAGYYLGTIFTAAIVLITLMSLRKLEKSILPRKYKSIEVLVTNKPGIIGKIGVVFGNYHISIKDIAVLESEFRDDEEGGLMEVRFAVKIPSSFDTNSLYRSIYSIPGVLSITQQGNIINYSNNMKSTFFDSNDN